MRKSGGKTLGKPNKRLLFQRTEEDKTKIPATVLTPKASVGAKASQSQRRTFFATITNRMTTTRLSTINQRRRTTRRA